MSYMQTRFITFIWMLTLGQCLTSKFIKQDNNRMIIIDEDGTSDRECCIYGKYHCSNLSLALQHMRNNTEIRIQSSISLHDIVSFGNISNVKITGNNSPTVRCDHQGGLVGKNINNVVIQGITWDTCIGITIINFTDGVHIIECDFLNFINCALALHGLGLATINSCAFSHNAGSVDVLAPSIIINGSKFYGNSKSASLFIDVSNLKNNLAYHGLINVSVENCKFSGNSGHSMHCIGSVGVVPKLSILSCNFTDNTNTAVNVEHCNITLNKVTFSNNVNADSGHINDGGAVRVYNGTVNMTGSVLFDHNRAGSNGGAVYLNHSMLVASKGSISFHNNTANNGGAIFIGEESSLFVLFRETNFELLNNHAKFNGGAVYVDLHYIKDTALSHQLSVYYSNLFTSENFTCVSDLSNTADKGNCAYFNENPLSPAAMNNNHYPDLIASSKCNFYDVVTYQNSTVYINASDINNADYSLKFWSHDLHLAMSIDCLDDDAIVTGPVNVSLQCCNEYNTNNPPFSCIYTEPRNCTVTGKNTTIECSNSKTIACNISAVGQTADIFVTVQRSGHICDDIGHAYSDTGICLPVCPTYSSSSHCWSPDIQPGYWYDNGFKQFVTTCLHCVSDQSFLFDEIYTTTATFPDQDIQCNDYWGGLACGECNYSVGHAIKYDTDECVPAYECSNMSVPYNLPFLFGASLFYWIVIISILFVLLHFKFDITAGYAYGLLFYYSVLEQLVNDATSNPHGDDQFAMFQEDFYDNYEFMRLKVLPFLSSIGNLKPPFTGFMNLCFGEAEMIDHLVIGYIHPLIVTCLVVIVFILARNFVLVARTIGRYVNSKSICILLLLSYSSITYTSMQLLKPLPVYDVYTTNTALQAYWSPTIQYFHGRHLCYGIIAILCVLIIGIGLPLVLIFQRYLTRYCNINFTSSKHIIDQLKGCYKDKYHWFAAYYLICRQVFYGVMNLMDLSPFPKFTIVLVISIIIVVIPLWIQPYKEKSLNILDSCILLALVGVLVSSLEDKTIGVILWFLPLLILINYLTCFTPLRHAAVIAIILSCTVILSLAIILKIYAYVFGIFLLASLFIVFIGYVVYNVKSSYTRCCNKRPRYVAINEEDDEVDKDDDMNHATEVHD